MQALPYQNYLFDLYGTLVDIHTDEDSPAAWEALARFYSYYGARYAPAGLQAAYQAEVDRQTAGKQACAGTATRPTPRSSWRGCSRPCSRPKGSRRTRPWPSTRGSFSAP